MAGEQIALLCLLRLRNALKATVTSKEFVDLKVFKSASDIILCDDFWKYLFMMCRALYAPMRVLRLADQKTPAMDKLYFYVLQADAMLPKYLGDLDKHVMKMMKMMKMMEMEMEMKMKMKMKMKMMMMTMTRAQALTLTN